MFTIQELTVKGIRSNINGIIVLTNNEMYERSNSNKHFWHLVPDKERRAPGTGMIFEDYQTKKL